MLSVVDAHYVDGYKIDLTFNDNREGCVDLKEFIETTKITPFKRLRDISAFMAFTVDYTVIWDKDLDLAPEYLYYEAFKDDPDLLPLFKKWGYVSGCEESDASMMKVAEKQAEYKTRNNP
ncbi:MAG: DUF2442 domain-containing protein [Verrucomicrobiota bacterium]